MSKPARFAVIVMFGGFLSIQQGACADADVASPTTRCAALSDSMARHWPDASTRVLSAHLVAAGPLPAATPPGAPPLSVDAPEHCELIAATQERIGEAGQHYAIRFHLRMPLQWNGRLYFQGGGGSNGVLGDALGVYSAAAAPALVQGFTVVSQDSGHDNAINNDPARGGVLAFGFDEKARANYGHASLPVVAKAAKAVIKIFYGADVARSYFVGCSKGGEEGMALAQRYASEFDGIAAGAPGMSLPRAALAEAWDTQAFAALVKSDTQQLSLDKVAASFSNPDLELVRAAVLAACDADDGVRDGIVGNFKNCGGEKVKPQLKARQCKAEKADGCLSMAQINALTRVLGGARDSQGKILYSDWPWDTGIAAAGWRIWKLGSPDGRPPSLNVLLGGASLASDFTTPPTPLSADPGALLGFLLAFDFDRDAAKIYATDAAFPRSAWEDISARSADLSAFRARGARLLVTHGVSDPVFSINDTIAWWREVNERNGGNANQFVRLFPVPGMTHCGGGDATDQFDVLAPLMAWVEHGEPPDSIIAGANPRTPWPKRTRPLCPYPAVAHYRGSGDTEVAANFECRS